MPVLEEQRWPNTDVVVFQDREGRWRARMRLTIGGSERTYYVPSDHDGVLTRMLLFLRVERALKTIGAEIGFPGERPEHSYAEELIEEIQKLRSELERFQFVVSQAPLDHPGLFAYAYYPRVDEQDEIKPVAINPVEVRGILEHVRTNVRALGDWSAYDNYVQRTDELLRVRADLELATRRAEDAEEKLERVRAWIERMENEGQR